VQDEELEASESDDDGSTAGDEELSCLHHIEAPPTLNIGTFFMQMAVGEDAVATALPSADAFDSVLGTAVPAYNSPQAKILGVKVEEDLMMLKLFLERLRTPEPLNGPGRTASS